MKAEAPEAPAGTIAVPCFCNGENPVCQKCSGSGWVFKLACPICKAMPHLVKTCRDCRGNGWRDMENIPDDN